MTSPIVHTLKKKQFLVFVMTLTRYQRVYWQFLLECWPSNRVSLRYGINGGSETSSVKSVDWRTEKHLTKDSETSSVELVLHVRTVPVQSPSCMDGNDGHLIVYALLNDRRVQGQRDVCTQNVVGITRIKLLLPQCSQII